jgi:hypothetical protein
MFSLKFRKEIGKSLILKQKFFRPFLFRRNDVIDIIYKLQPPNFLQIRLYYYIPIF